MPAFPASPPTPNWRRCPAKSCSSSAANSTASRSSTRKIAGLSQGTKAEKRAERSVANWLLLGGLSGVALLLVFLFWPWEYKGEETEGHWWYDLATPMYGLTFGLSILAIGIGAVLYQKKFIPEEISIQDRHDGRLARDSAQDRRGQPLRCAGRLDDQAAQAGRAVARHRPRRIRCRHTGRVHRRSDQEPMEASGSDRRGQEGRAVDIGMDPEIQRRDHLHGARHRKRRPRSTVRQDAPRGPRRGRHGNGVPVAGVRRRRHHRRITPPAQPDHDGRSQPGDAHPHQAGRHGKGWSSGRARRASTSATCSPTPRCAPTWVAPLRFTSSRPIASSARATSRSSTRCTSLNPYSARLRAPLRSCPSPSTRTGIWSPTATSSSPSVRHSGNGKR